MADPATQLEKDSLPEITLRIPGPWESPERLADTLTKTNTGYAIEGGAPDGDRWLVHRPSGQKFRLSAVRPDEEVALLFANSGRMRPDEIRAVEDHRVKVFVVGPGGSIEAARMFLDIGAAMIAAGAAGVMVDNSGNCHGPRDWLDLADDSGLGGLYWAFVSVAGGSDEIFSVGMHCLGFRDAELPEPVDRQTGGMIVHEFLGYSYQSGTPIVDGDPIGGPDGPEFILRHVECTRFEKGTAFHNPYGVWRLEKTSESSE